MSKVLVRGVLAVVVLLVLATGGHPPAVTMPATSSPAAPAAPQSPVSGQSWDAGLVSLALALSNHLIWLAPLVLVLAGVLYISHVGRRYAKPLLVSAALGAAFVLLAPVLIALLPQVLAFRDHIVQELGR